MRAAPRGLALLLRPCTVALSLLAASLCAGAWVPPARAQAAPATGEVRVQVLGVANGEGQLLVALHRSEAYFPERGERAYGRKAVRARAGSVEVVFEGVPPGTFAIAAFHDADANFKLKKGLFGRPREGYGFSRDARAPFGPPDFAAARLSLQPGEHKLVRVRLRY